MYTCLTRKRLGESKGRGWIRKHNCIAGERVGESEGRGWVRLLGELDPDPGKESAKVEKFIFRKHKLSNNII